jgi:hypothetical protein
MGEVSEEDMDLVDLATINQLGINVYKMINVMNRINNNKIRHVG